MVMIDNYAVTIFILLGSLIVLVSITLANKFLDEE